LRGGESEKSDRRSGGVAMRERQDFLGLSETLNRQRREGRPLNAYSRFGGSRKKNKEEMSTFG